MLTTQTGRLTTLLVLISLALVEPCIAVAQDSEATYEERLASAKSLLRLNQSLPHEMFIIHGNEVN